MSGTNKILLVEDDKFIARAYKDGLEEAGFEVETTETGEETIEKLKEFSPDLLLLDLIIPEKDGFEVMEEMKMNDDIEKMPVIVVSNLGQNSDIDKAKELGAVDYLIKSDHSMKDVIEKVKYQLAK